MFGVDDNLKIVKENLKGLERKFWQELVEKLQINFQMIAPHNNPQLNKPALQSGHCRLLIKAQPGTNIRGLELGLGPDQDQEPELQTTDEAGELRLELPKYRTYTLTAVNPGYYPIEQTIYLSRAEQTVSLRQKARTRWAAGLYLYNLNYPGVEGTYYPIPDLLFLRAALTEFLWALPAWEPTNDVASPVLDFSFSCGLNLFNADFMVHSYLALGTTVRLMQLEESFALDYNVSSLFLGFSPVFGLALKIFPRLQIYAEYCPLFYLQPSLLLNKFVYDLLCVNAGIRLLF